MSKIGYMSSVTASPYHVVTIDAGWTVEANVQPRLVQASLSHWLMQGVTTVCASC